MRCADVHESLKSGQAPSGTAVDEHVAECPPCRALIEAGGELGARLASATNASAPPEPTRALRKAVGQAIDAETGPVAWLRSRTTSTRWAIGVGVAFAVAGASLGFMARADLGVYPLERMIALVALHAILIGAAVGLALRGLQKRAPSLASRALIIGLAVTVPILAGLLPMAHALHPASVTGAGDDFGRRALGCFVFGVLMAAPILVVLRLLDRASHASMTRVALAASGAGLAGALALQFHCPTTHPGHLLAGHGAVVAALLLAYAGVGRMTAKA